MIITISILSVLVVIFGFTTFNLLIKNEKQEDILISYKLFFDKISESIKNSDEKIKKIDENGAFKSDDMVGFFFTNLKLIQNELNQFKIK